MNTLRNALTALLLAAAGAASAVPLLQNGSFEAGLAGWTVTNHPASFVDGTWYAATGTLTPLSLHDSVGPHGGTTYAVTDQPGPGAHALTQGFTVAAGATSVILNFSMFVDSMAPFIDNGGGVLDYTLGPGQFARVDLLTGSADAFDTGAGVLATFYFGVGGDILPNPYIDYTEILTPFVTGGGTYQLRFAETDNQNFLNMGVDDVGIDAQFQAVPEPGTVALVGLGLAGLALARRRRH